MRPVLTEDGGIPKRLREPVTAMNLLLKMIGSMVHTLSLSVLLI